MENRNNNNTIAIAVGFILILLIAGITIIRPYFSEKKSSTITTTQLTDNTPTTDPKRLSNEQLISKIASMKNLILLDIRDTDAFALEHLANSVNIPFEQLATKINSLEKNKSYIVIDNGDQSGQIVASEFLPQNGATNTFYLSGGFPSWKSGNNPTVSAGNPSSIIDQSKITYTNSQDLKNLLEQNSAFFIIDLRSADNFKSGHIKNAVSIPLDELEKRYKEIPIGKQIILYDKDGLWAFQGGVRLFDLGVFNVWTLSDGLDGWKQKNFALEK